MIPAALRANSLPHLFLFRPEPLTRTFPTSITDGDRPVGIVTDVNLTRLLADGHDPETTVVEAIMTSPVISPNSLPWNA